MSSTLKDYISKLPLTTISKVRLYPNKVSFPVVINSKKFYEDFADKINSDEFTNEKALYVASKYEIKKYLNSIDLLNSRLRYT